MRWAKTGGLVALCALAGSRASTWVVGADGSSSAVGGAPAGKSSPTGTFYSNRAWGPLVIDPELLVFDANVSFHCSSARAIDQGRLQELEFATISDLDHSSMFCGVPPKVVPPQFENGVEIVVPPESPSCEGVPFSERMWISLLRRGVLHMARSASGNEGRDRYPVYHVKWMNTSVLATRTNMGGRSMELSELVRFRHLLLAMCDYTGMVWKLRLEDGSIFQRYSIADGHGEVPKPCKIEWATRMDGKLVVGSVGKPFLDLETGAFINRNSEWVKFIDQNGRIENVDWGPVYAALRTAAGVTARGYLWHEAIDFDALSRRWIVLPRKRGLTDPYHPDRDELMGTNVLLVADEQFKQITRSHWGPLEDDWGFTAVRRVPGQRDVFIVLKSREVAKSTRTVGVGSAASARGLTIALAEAGRLFDRGLPAVGGRHVD
jgi:hypothetical protein